jgi:hypothetical protein
LLGLGNIEIASKKEIMTNAYCSTNYLLYAYKQHKFVIFVYVSTILFVSVALRERDPFIFNPE